MGLKRRQPERPDGLDGLPAPPAELSDPAHPLWRDRDAYRGWMDARSYTLPSADRLDGSEAGASHRRRWAAAGWAQEVGAVRGTMPDWHRLRSLGLS